MLVKKWANSIKRQKERTFRTRKRKKRRNIGVMTLNLKKISFYILFFDFHGDLFNEEGQKLSICTQVNSTISLLLSDVMK